MPPSRGSIASPVRVATLVALAVGLMLQGYVFYHTRAAKATVAALRHDYEAIGDVRERHKAAMVHWERVAAEAQKAVAEVAKEAEAAAADVAAAEEDAAAPPETHAPPVDDYAPDSTQPVDPCASALPPRPTLTVGDLEDEEKIFEGARYKRVGTDYEPAGEAHRALLKVGKQLLRFTTVQCAIEAWRDFLDPFIKAVEKRKDAMLYNYI